MTIFCLDQLITSVLYTAVSSKRGVRNLQEAGMDKLQQCPPDDIKLLKKYLKNGTNLLNIPIVVLDGDLATTIDMSVAAVAQHLKADAD